MKGRSNPPFLFSSVFVLGETQCRLWLGFSVLPQRALGARRNATEASRVRIRSMHANPQRVQPEEPGPTLRLLEQPGTTTLAPLIFRFLNLLRNAVWRAFQHDVFAIAKASAYSSILTFFPTLLAVR